MTLADKLKTRDVWLAIGVIGFGLFLLFFAIPNYVNSPSNIPNIVLSPKFWPTIIAWIIITLGALLLLSRFFVVASASSDDADGEELTSDQRAWAWGRVITSGVIMVGLVIATPIIGMVLATGIAFALFALIVMSPKPVTSIIVAILLPLVLYAFFAHVAGVSVPQGGYLILP